MVKSAKQILLFLFYMSKIIFVFIIADNITANLHSEAARLQDGHHLLASPTGALPALSDRLLVEMHMHEDVQRVVDLDRL